MAAKKGKKASKPLGRASMKKSRGGAVVNVPLGDGSVRGVRSELYNPYITVDVSEKL